MTKNKTWLYLKMQMYGFDSYKKLAEACNVSVNSIYCFVARNTNGKIKKVLESYFLQCAGYTVLNVKKVTVFYKVNKAVTQFVIKKQDTTRSYTLVGLVFDELEQVFLEKENTFLVFNKSQARFFFDCSQNAYTELPLGAKITRKKGNFFCENKRIA